MTKYYMTETRNGQWRPNRKIDLFASNMEEAIEEFSKKILTEISESTDYSFIGSEEELKEALPGYEWKGRGYYLHPDSGDLGREHFYAENAKFDRYYRDVFRYTIEEEVEELDAAEEAEE